MGTRDPRVDRYIADSPEFARPILTHLRDVIHDACPEVVETMKWSRPHFEYEGLLCGMSAFRAHCAFGFWKGSLILGKGGGVEDAMGQFGRITSVRDLPPRKVLAGYVRKAMALNEAGTTAFPKKATREPRPELPVPDDLAAALGKSRKARATFEGLSPSHRREYIEWITEAKREETRRQRLATTVEWLAEGKTRNWKYARA